MERDPTEAEAKQAANVRLILCWLVDIVIHMSSVFVCVFVCLCVVSR
jgi:hypothetical protein